MGIGYHITKPILQKNAFIALFILFSVLAQAQKISVINFYLAENDLTAQNKKTAVEDQNGDKCALIRIQTTQKGFSFDVGSAGVQKTDDNHVGEIWLYVPYGIKHISIRHPLLGSLSNYNFPISIEKARTYVMEITSDKVFVNKYDDTRKQKLSIKITPTNSSLTLNGMVVPLNTNGEAEQEMAFGTYTYKVEATGFYPKEGQIEINDSVKKQTLIINDLKPIMGKLYVHVNPRHANVYVDEVLMKQKSILEPYEVQIGKHKVKVTHDGYGEEEREVDIVKDKTCDLAVSLKQEATYMITSNPAGAHVKIGKYDIGKTPYTIVLTTGTYDIRATKTGYKDFKRRMYLNSANPNVQINLNKTMNYKNEGYIEANVKAGTFMAFGATIGGYIYNVNVEASYLVGSGNSETIYWSGNNTRPIASQYTPSMIVGGKVGYGIPIGSRFRLTPQIGLNVLKLKEKMENGTTETPANGANVTSGLASIRFSAAIVNHFAISVSPEFSFKMMESDGYKTLSEISPTIKKWSNGFNVKLGLIAFF